MKRSVSLDTLRLDVFLSFVFVLELCIQFSRYILAFSAIQNSGLPGSRIGEKTFERFAGGLLLSHAVSSVVPSAACVLTIVFGMGTGVPRRRIATGKSELYHVQLNSKTHHALSRSLLVYS